MNNFNTILLVGRTKCALPGRCPFVKSRVGMRLWCLLLACCCRRHLLYGWWGCRSRNGWRRRRESGSEGLHGRGCRWVRRLVQKQCKPFLRQCWIGPDVLLKHFTPLLLNFDSVTIRNRGCIRCRISSVWVVGWYMCRLMRLEVMIIQRFECIGHGFPAVEGSNRW